jgi:DnaJ-domain-containing protein 1
MEIIRRLFQVVRANTTAATVDRDDQPSGGAEYDKYSRPSDYQRPRPNDDPRLASYYANLELKYGASRDEVRVAWKRLMKTYHPDLHAADPEKRRIANELTAELTNAYQQLDSALGNAAV